MWYWVGYQLFIYLFTLCVEAFSNMLPIAEGSGDISGVRFAPNVMISHLLFADDNLIFYSAPLGDCSYLFFTLSQQLLGKVPIMISPLCFSC